MTESVPIGREHVITETKTVSKPAESKAETKARLEREALDHAHGLWERTIVVWLGVAAVSLLAIVSAVVMFVPALSEQRGTALSALVGIVTSLAGYIFGSRRRGPD